MKRFPWMTARSRGCLLAVLALGVAHSAFGATPAPTISGYVYANPRGVAISSAPPGAPLLIEGENLGTNGTVVFNGVPAPPPASWSPTEILVTVPTPPAYPFKGPVTVTTNGQTARGPGFTITPPPPINGPGSLDPSFGSGGRVFTAIGGMAEARAMAVQPNGQIVVAGWSDAAKGGFTLARYNRDGSLDSSFGTGGRVLTDFGGEGGPDYGGANAVAVQPDGQIVAAGQAAPAIGSEYFALARYTVNGSVDTTFGTGGTVLTDFGGFTGANAAALQPDGRIVAAGEGYDANGNGGFALTRYTANGTLDPAFGSGGKVVTLFFGGRWANAVAVQPDGRIVAAGWAGNCGPYCSGRFALARYNADGSLDATFGTVGQVLTDFVDPVRPNALALQPDGRIVVAGIAWIGDFGDEHGFALARYKGDGSLDPSFGTGGQVLTHFGVDAQANAVAVQADGRIVAAGDQMVARYNGDGTLDSSFGTGGAVQEDFGINAVALQPDGRIVVAGEVDAANGTSYIALARYRGR